MLAVIDYGAGNLRSVLHSLKYLQAHDVQVIHEADQLQTATKVILPGVGAFGAGMQQLHILLRQYEPSFNRERHS